MKNDLFAPSSNLHAIQTVFFKLVLAFIFGGTITVPLLANTAHAGSQIYTTLSGDTVSNELIPHFYQALQKYVSDSGFNGHSDDYWIEQIDKTAGPNVSIYFAVNWKRDFGGIFQILQVTDSQSANPIVTTIYSASPDRVDFSSPILSDVYPGEPAILFVWFGCIGADPHCAHEEGFSFGEEVKRLNVEAPGFVYRYEDLNQDGAPEAIAVERYWGDLYASCALCGPRPRSILVREKRSWRPACTEFSDFYERYTTAQTMLK